MRGVLLLMLATIVVLILSAPSELSAADEDIPVQDLYPDADIIITEGKNNATLVMYKSTTSEGVVSYDTKRYASGSPITLLKASDRPGSSYIVMASGTISTLTLLSVDAYDADNMYMVESIRFLHVSGTISSLLVLSSTNDISSKLPAYMHITNYYTIDNISLTLRGSIGNLNLTNDRVRIGSLDIAVEEGAHIPLMYPTGRYGRFDDVSITMTGGSVGYMANKASVVIASMTYKLEHGSINYLCLGADTEGSGLDLADQCTFYVRGDVSVTISSYITIGSAILGAGITDAPALLCDGEEPNTVIGRNVVISGGSLVADRSFLLSSDRAYRFNSYTIDAQPAVAFVNTAYGDSKQRYGDEGIWPSVTGCTISPGTTLRISSDVYVLSWANLSVESGATMRTSGEVVVLGTITVEGAVKNAGFIAILDESTVIDGLDGYVAKVIYVSQGNISVMASGNSVFFLPSEDSISFLKLEMLLNDTTTKMVIASQSSNEIGTFSAGLEVVDEKKGIWRLFIDNFSTESMSVSIEISIVLEENTKFRVVNAQGQAVTSAYSYADSILTIFPNGNGTYHIEYIEDVEEESWFSKNWFNISVALGIIAVAAVIVYLLLRHD